MREQLDMLGDLQEIDKKRTEIIKELETIPKAIERLTNAQKEEDNTVREIKQSITNHEKEKREKDTELSINNERFERFKDRLSSIKTNIEYQASLKEIDQSKKMNEALEDELLVLMEKLEEEQKELTEAETVLTEKISQMEGEKKTLSKKQKQADKDLKGIMNERELQLNNINPKVAHIYETLRKKIKGVIITTENNGSCTSCHLGVPPQLINDAMKYEKVYMCPHCSRILFVDRE